MFVPVAGWLFLIGTLPMITLGLGYYRYINRLLEKEYSQRLSSIAQRQINTIEDTISKSGKLVETFANTRRMASLVPALQKAKKEENAQLQEELTVQCDNLIGKISSGFGFDDFIMFDREGNLLYSASKNSTFLAGIFDKNFKYPNLRVAFEDAIKYLGTQVAKLDLEPHQKAPAFFMATPIIIEQRLLGVIVVRPSSKEIYRITNDYNGLDPTGETLLVSRHKEDFIFFGPSRFGLSPGLNQTIIQGSAPFNLLCKPLNHTSGTGLGVDYRNEDVVASWNYIPSAHWGIIVKGDANAALKPMVEVRRYAFFVGTLTTMLLIFCASFIAANLTQPFRFLSRIIQEMVKGRLYFDFRSIRNRGQLELFNSTKDLLDSLCRLREELERLVIKAISELQALGSDVNACVDTNHNLDQYLSTITQKVQKGLMISKTINKNLKTTSIATEDIAVIAESSAEDLQKIRTLFHEFSLYSESLSTHFEIINTEFSKTQDFSKELVQLCDTINLIFINAMIESKKAGIEGTGFRVIAKEIQNFSERLFLVVSRMEISFETLLSRVSKSIAEAQNASEKLKNNSAIGHRSSAQLIEVVQQIQGVPFAFENSLSQMQAQEELLRETSSCIKMMLRAGDELHIAFSQTQKEFSQLTKSCYNLHLGVQRFHVPAAPITPRKE